VSETKTLRGPAPAARVDWLDGLRGAAAMFVVLHHMWLGVFAGFPRDTGPWYLGAFLYGHLAVAVFIVVSGFSLALGPLRSDWRLKGGVKRFLRRRAWRILPAYWAALGLSMLITATLLRPELTGGQIAGSISVHGLLLQDVVGSETPNGAFWSIAVEWQIYFVFPLILLCARRWSMPAAIAATVAIVLVAHVVARLGGPLHKIDDLTPQFLALFGLGVFAAAIGHSGHRRLRLIVGGLGLAAFLAFVASAIALGSVWVVDRYFAVDLVVGLAVACLLAVLFAGGGAPIRRLFASKVAMRIGLFSYSIYLIHGPMVGVIEKYVIAPLNLAPVAKYGIFLAIGLPIVLALSYAFHLLFEAPFLQIREWRALRTLPAVQLLRRMGRPRPVDVAPAPERA
jgi:peptidoglycan/LPS O-acetylase OafA/YrhL